MNEAFIRTALQLGEEAVEKLNRSRVAVFGIGGVGGQRGVGAGDHLILAVVDGEEGIDQPVIFGGDDVFIGRARLALAQDVQRRAIMVRPLGQCQNTLGGADRFSVNGDRVGDLGDHGRIRPGGVVDIALPLQRVALGGRAHGIAVCVNDAHGDGGGGIADLGRRDADRDLIGFDHGGIRHLKRDRCRDVGTDKNRKCGQHHRCQHKRRDPFEFLHNIPPCFNHITSRVRFKGLYIKTSPNKIYYLNKFGPFWHPRRESNTRLILRRDL